LGRIGGVDLKIFKVAETVSGSDSLVAEILHRVHYFNETNR